MQGKSEVSSTVAVSAPSTNQSDTMQQPQQVSSPAADVTQSVAVNEKPAKAPVTKRTAVRAAATTTTITVHSGDTLWSLATHYHTTVSHLESLNGLQSSTLHIGQKLKVSGSASSVGAAKSTKQSSLSGRSDSSVASLGADAEGVNIAQFAQRFVGVPYRWGGTSPSGFDCSGLVLYVFGHFGIGLPRTSYSMTGAGSSVSRSDLMPGDLVFFDTYGPGASHVGIYIGGGQFISAQSSGVHVASLGESYWADHYIGARSVVS